MPVPPALEPAPFEPEPLEPVPDPEWLPVCTLPPEEPLPDPELCDGVDGGGLALIGGRAGVVWTVVALLLGAVMG